jgi:hypothetical protein
MANVNKKQVVVAPFEQSRSEESMPDMDNSIKTPADSIKDLNVLVVGNDIFEELLASSSETDERANELKDQIEEIKTNNASELEKNFTFKLLFNSIKQSLEEYKTQTLLFKSYTKA